MSKAKELVREKNVYRVKGFTCANCASTFEKNVKNLKGVDNAQARQLQLEVMLE